MRPMLIFAAMCLLVACATGCLIFESQTVITAEGSGTNSMVFAIAKTEIAAFQNDLRDQLAAAMGREKEAIEVPDIVGRAFDSMKANAEAMPADWHTRTETIDTDTHRGLKITMKFASIEMLQTQMRRMFRGSPITEASVVRDGTAVTIKATVRPQMLIEQANGNAMPADDLREKFESAHFAWAIEMPRIESFEAAGIGTRDGNRVTWVFPFDADRAAGYTIEVRGHLTAQPAEQTPNTNGTE